MKRIELVIDGVHNEYTPVEGNAMNSGDPEFDKSVEQGIRERLARGDFYAWCMVNWHWECEVDEGVRLFTDQEQLGRVSVKDAEDLIELLSGHDSLKDKLIESLKELGLEWTE